jgi:hypothetical protein
MKTIKLCLALAVSACAVASAQTASNEHGIPDAPTRMLNSSSSQTGTILKRDLRWRSKVPLNKTYGELTAEQKAAFHALYETLPEGDEPPFPVKGIKPIFSQLQQGQRVLQARGELNLAVTVGSDGNAIKVEDFGGVTGANAYEMTNYAQSLLMMAKYKPALCKGQPCVMQFPFKLPLN